MNVIASRLRALVGPARSGTTWAGTIVDSSPEVIYRFEPFHRMAAVDAEFRNWMVRLKEQSVCEYDIPRLYSLLCRAHPLTNKPPFFPEKTYHLPTLGRGPLWPIARKFPFTAKFYGSAYSPQAGPTLVFKEVTFIKQLRNLVEMRSVPVVYLVRHPCATVLSEINGQMHGKMPTGRVQRLREILLEHDPSLADRFADVVTGSDMVKRAALLWRCEIERCIPMVRDSKVGMVLTYEQLVDDAHAHAGAILAHFGVRYTEQTQRFIESLYELHPAGRSRARRSGWGDKYFSVFRNPRAQKDAWKDKITPGDRRKVDAIVEDSAAVSYCAALGGWS